MNKYNKLPDTPWHLGYPKKKDNDPRRHRARCIHIEKGNPPICKCTYSPAFLFNCSGSSHCKYYSETQRDWELFLEGMMTEEERAIVQYQMKKIRKKNMLLKDPLYIRKLSLYPKMRGCPICTTLLKELQCSYCGAKFQVSTDYSPENIADFASKGIFIIPQNA